VGSAWLLTRLVGLDLTGNFQYEVQNKTPDFLPDCRRHTRKQP
jgi:hypothetical protein